MLIRANTRLLKEKEELQTAAAMAKDLKNQVKALVDENEKLEKENRGLKRRMVEATQEARTNEL